jgi:hypothetical protein
MARGAEDLSTSDPLELTVDELNAGKVAASLISPQDRPKLVEQVCQPLQHGHVGRSPLVDPYLRRVFFARARSLFSTKTRPEA